MKLSEWIEILDKITHLIPTAVDDTDNDGQIIIYTGLKIVEDDKGNETVEEFESE